MKVFVVIPNWNGADMLENCLNSLIAQTQKHQIIIVDNGSTDNSLDLINKYNDISLIKNSKNLGFTGGVNPGMQYALDNDAFAIALFNNDAVADKRWLEVLCKELKNNPKIGIATPKIMLEDKIHLDSTGDFYSVYGIPFPRGRNQEDKNQFDQKTQVFGASGGASLYRAAMLKQIGLMDDNFFAYYEDVDLSFRSQLAGWNVKYCPESVVYHGLSKTSSKMGDFTRYHSIKNFLIVYTKNMPAKLCWKYLPKFLYQFSRTTIRSIVDLKFGIYLKALSYFLIHLPEILSARHKIQSNKKVTDAYIDSVLFKTKPEKISSLDEK